MERDAVRRLAEAIDRLVQRRSAVRIAVVTDPRVDPYGVRAADYLHAKIGESQIVVLADRGAFFLADDQIYVRPVGSAADRRWVFVGHAHRVRGSRAGGYGDAGALAGSIDINSGTTGILETSRLPASVRISRLRRKEDFTADGVTAVFTLAEAPVIGNEEVARNGLEQRLGVDYTLSGATLTMLDLPGAGELISIDYDVVE